MRVAVVQLTQNCERYYKREFLTIFKAINGVLKDATWFFIENDSTDATAEIIKRYGHALSLHLPKETVLSSRCTMRTQRLAFLRNTAMQWVSEFGSFDYIVWLDTNVTVSAASFRHLFDYIQQDETVGLAAANTLQQNTKSHYYDTYALDTDSCMWKECETCEGQHSMTQNVEVSSAFGGLCITRGSLNLTFAATHNQCEHVYMCAKIKEQGKKIVVVGCARAFWRP